MGLNDFNVTFSKKFINIEQAISKAEEARLEASRTSPCSYPLECLNDFLYGILPSELIVIGADTGVGKTWLANEFARINALKKKKVYLFSLEGDDNEVIEKFRYHIIAKEYFKKPDGREMSYTNYLLGKVPLSPEWIALANKELDELNGYLEIYDKSEGLTIESLTQQMTNIKDADLVIIDHLHYFYFRDDKPESTQITEIMRRIKELTEINHIPVVLISHLRKKEKNRGLPDNEDFMGSSNIAKIATKTILLNIDYSQYHENSYPTIIRVCKDRFGMKSNIGFLNKFDIQQHSYSKDYLVVKIDGFANYEEITEDKMPYWVKCLYKRTFKGTEIAWDE